MSRAPRPRVENARARVAFRRARRAAARAHYCCGRAHGRGLSGWAHRRARSIFRRAKCSPRMFASARREPISTTGTSDEATARGIRTARGINLLSVVFNGEERASSPTSERWAQAFRCAEKC